MTLKNNLIVGIAFTLSLSSAFAANLQPAAGEQAIVGAPAASAHTHAAASDQAHAQARAALMNFRDDMQGMYSHSAQHQASSLNRMDVHKSAAKAVQEGALDVGIGG